VPLVLPGNGGGPPPPAPPPPPGTPNPPVAPPPKAPAPPPAPPPAPAAGPPDVRGYTGGWCTWYVALVCPWIPAGLGDAHTWCDRASAHNLGITPVPTVGSVVQYSGGHLYSNLGHVAFVRNVYGPNSFEVAEAAYIAWNQVDVRLSNMTDVQCFILPPGVNPGAGAPPPTPPPNDPNGLMWGTWGWLADFVGRVVPDAVNAIATAAARLGDSI
jgi:hypothetical protein